MRTYITFDTRSKGQLLLSGVSSGISIYRRFTRIACLFWGKRLARWIHPYWDSYREGEMKIWHAVNL